MVVLRSLRCVGNTSQFVPFKKSSTEHCKVRILQKLATQLHILRINSKSTTSPVSLETQLVLDSDVEKKLETEHQPKPKIHGSFGKYCTCNVTATQDRSCSGEELGDP